MKSKGSSIVGYSRHSRCRLWQLPVHQSSMISCAIVCWHLGLMDMDVGFEVDLCHLHSIVLSTWTKAGLETPATSANLYDLCLTNILILVPKEPWQLFGCSAVVHTPSRQPPVGKALSPFTYTVEGHFGGPIVTASYKDVGNWTHWASIKRNDSDEPKSNVACSCYFLPLYNGGGGSKVQYCKVVGDLRCLVCSMIGEGVPFH